MWKFFVLFAIAIPWYWLWMPEQGTRTVMGMPLWFVVSVVGSFAISILAAWKLNQPWPDELSQGETASPSLPDEPGSAEGSGGF